MSTVQTNRVQHSSGAGNNIQLDDQGNVVCAADVQMASQNNAQLAGRRSVIINGDMMINERVEPTTPGQGYRYGCDRFKCFAQNATGNYLIERSEPTELFKHGFFQSVVSTVNQTATVSDPTDVWIPFEYACEGHDVQRFSLGLPEAKTFTVSFWVKASIAGSYSFAAFSTLHEVDDADKRSYVTTFTVSAVNTWEYKTITIPGCTDGTWDKGQGVGLYVSWGAYSGSNLETSTTESWVTGLKEYATGSTNLMGTAGANIGITGVQIELGQATPFEFLTHPLQLLMCKRYFQVFRGDFGFNSSGADAVHGWGVAAEIRMARAPDVTVVTYGGTNNVKGINIYNADAKGMKIEGKATGAGLTYADSVGVYAEAEL